MEPEGSLPCSQQPAIGLYSEPDEYSPQPHTLFRLRLGLPSRCFHSCFRVWETTRLWNR